MELAEQRRLPLKIKSRIALVGLDSARGAIGLDAESVIAMKDSGQLKCVFNVACNPDDARRQELRFFVPELIAHTHETPFPFSIDEVIADILGAREMLRRSELEIEWIISHVHVMRLIRDGHLQETGNRLLRSTVENFLRKRWIGGAQ
jgi:hypothetical protein